MFESLPITVSIEALYILYVLQKNGFEAYIVGGAVRDTLLNALKNDKKNNVSTITAADYDFTTNAKPDEIQKIFPENFYENTFGTVGIAYQHLVEQMGRMDTIITTHDSELLPKNKTIKIDEATKIHKSLQDNKQDAVPVSNKNGTIKNIYEITTFRSDGTYTDFRRPESVTWGETLEEDLNRRDFTINALALRISQDFLEEIDFTSENLLKEIQPDSYQTIDLHSGTQDLISNTIKTVGDPNKRFNEDALRMLRAIRFCVQLNMQIDPETFTAILDNSALLKHISLERISDEFLKMLQSNSPKLAIELLDATKLLSFIIPELTEAKGVKQGGHHTTDVWTHSLNALECCPSKDPVVRLATLLHDIAKPTTYKEIQGKPTFYNHEIIGSRIAKNIAQRLRLPRKDIERVFLLVRYHMFYYQPEHTDASIRRFMRKVGLENINDILDLREADRLGSGAKKTSWRLEEMKERMISQLHQPFSITDMNINGHDLMDNFNIKPGPKLGEVLNQLFELVLENPELNQKDVLLQRAQQLLGS